MRDSLPEKAKVIRDAIIKYCVYRAGQYYATPQGCTGVQRILDEHRIPATVSIGDDGKFLIAVKVSDLL